MAGRLERRVKRLEGGTNPDEVLVGGFCPTGVTSPRCREIAEAKARECGYEPPFRIDMQETGRPGGESDIGFWFIGTGAELMALIHDIQWRNRQDV